MKILIVEAEELYRIALRELVSVCAPSATIIEISSKDEIFAHTREGIQPSLIIISPHILHQDPKRGLHNLCQQFSASKVIAIARSQDINRLQHTHNCVITRAASLQTFAKTIRTTIGKPFADDHIENNVPIKSSIERVVSGGFEKEEAEKISQLSGRQYEILKMVSDGLANKEIAHRLGIAEGTVKAHMHAIFRHLEVTNRTQAVVRFGGAIRSACRMGWKAHESHDPQKLSAAY